MNFQPSVVGKMGIWLHGKGENETTAGLFVSQYKNTLQQWSTSIQSVHTRTKENV